VEPTGTHEVIPAGLVLRSIGYELARRRLSRGCCCCIRDMLHFSDSGRYKSIRAEGVPFDTKRAVVQNVQGRVVTDDGASGTS
jgi:hypothetical protein